MKNFEPMRAMRIKELHAAAKIYRHIPTGAEILSIENDDENKCFGIAFRTPPSDSTGVPHIMEHTVLCGSEKYPVKDPFVQLLKGSLQTFLNAFTYPDKTCYPVASQNLKDFHNLVEVYLDAVFNPRITRELFMQEGWHYELETPNSELKLKGVVYNEMKGSYSSPDSLLMETSRQSLFPDTTYGHDAGGNPRHIPKLTYEQFRAFHKSFYHPSNACIFFYGNDPLEKRFELLESYLKQYETSLLRPVIAKQMPFLKPIRMEKTYAVSETEALRPMFTINWALPSPIDAKTVYEFSLLDHILLGTPASPLRKALIESGLGEDIAGSGIETHLIQMVCSIGLKGVERSNLEPAEKLVFQTLETLAEQGINQHDIEAALHTFEFELRENNSGGFPRGLSLWLKSLNSWIYDADPVELIAFEKPLQRLKIDALKPGFFERKLRENFIENLHRSTVIMMPDAKKTARIENAQKKRMAAIKAQMNQSERKGIAAQSKRLLELQAEPDSEEALATLPLLHRKDLDKKNRLVERDEYTFHGTTVLTHNLFTNGIIYLDIGLDLHGLQQEDIPYASLLSGILLEMGTRNEDYTSLSQRIARKTGGIYGTPFLSALEHTGKGTTRFFLRGKCMNGQATELLEIFHNILLQTDFSNKERFRQIVLEYKSEMESEMTPHGHSTVMTRLKARYNEAYWVGEQIGGIEALFFLRELSETLDENWECISRRLERIRQRLIDRSHIVINLTADSEAIPGILQLLERFIETFPQNDGFFSKNWNLGTFPPSEALTAPTEVNYVGCSANLFDFGYELHGSALVIARYLQTAWLWEKIRVQGGAYGSMCAFDQRSGVFAFSSYRDPNLERTLDIYRKTGTYLKNLRLDEDELTRALIGAIGQLDAYQLPDAKGFSSCLRYLLNHTDAKRQQLRDEVLAATQHHFNTFGEILDAAFRHSATAVLCSPKAAEQAALHTQTKVF